MNDAATTYLFCECGGTVFDPIPTEPDDVGALRCLQCRAEIRFKRGSDDVLVDRIYCDWQYT